MSEVTITKAQPEDVPDLKAIEVECGLSPWRPESYKSELKRPDSVILTAFINNKMIGFIAGRVPVDVKGDAEINNIGVLPDFRGRGIGKTLLDRFRGAAIQRGARAIWLEVRASNSSAISLYRSLGFVARGVRRSFYRDPVEDAQLMALSVDDNPPNRS
jgi:[ribosomal protein S18]-alanine N-acetyltransferase